MPTMIVPKAVPHSPWSAADVNALCGWRLLCNCLVRLDAFVSPTGFIWGFRTRALSHGERYRQCDLN